MSDYIKHKEYKLPDGRTVTADFDELGIAKITIQAMDALFDILNSSWEKSNRKRQQKTIDVVEVVRCKDCKFYEIYPNGANGDCINQIDAFNTFYPNDFCSYGERADK